MHPLNTLRNKIKDLHTAPLIAAKSLTCRWETMSIMGPVQQIMVPPLNELSIALLMVPSPLPPPFSSSAFSRSLLFTLTVPAKSPTSSLAPNWPMISCPHFLDILTFLDFLLPHSSDNQFLTFSMTLSLNRREPQGSIQPNSSLSSEPGQVDGAIWEQIYYPNIFCLNPLREPAPPWLWMKPLGRPHIWSTHFWTRKCPQSLTNDSIFLFLVI